MELDHAEGALTPRERKGPAGQTSGPGRRPGWAPWWSATGSSHAVQRALWPGAVRGAARGWTGRAGDMGLMCGGLRGPGKDFFFNYGKSHMT